MRNFFVSVQELYSEVGSRLPTFSHNPCQGCNACCTAAHTTDHRVTELEFAYLADRLGGDRVRDFRHYIERQRGADGELLHQRCPFNEAEVGCTIHPDRPLSCRLYGHYRSQDEPELADFCVFKGEETLVNAEDKRAALPGNLELNRLTLEYCSHLPASKTPPSRRPPQRLGSHSHPLELVYEALADEDSSRALQLFERVELADRTPLAWRMMGACLQELGEHSKAEEYFRVAVRNDPDNPQGYYKLGSHFLLTGDLLEARKALEQSLALSDKNADTLGLLAVVYHLEADFKAAETTLRQALEHDPEACFVHLQLGRSLACLGRIQEARESFLRAQSYQETSELAEEAMRLYGV